MKSAPFSHAWGSSISVYIVATNAYGDSAPSARGNGAIIITKPDAPTHLIEDTLYRLPAQVGLEWLEGETNGGSTVIDYRLSYDQTTDTWIELQANILLTEIIVQPLVTGSTYKFKVQARNAYGLSDDSNILTILIADEPSQVAQPTTSVSLSNIIIDWVAPSDNGSPITSYQIYIKQADEQYSQEMVDCDGTLAATISNTQCTIPISTLTASPYSLVVGDEVFVNIIAVNLYGESVVSMDGNGAIIAYVPDMPVNLANDLSVTSATIIKITWDQGASNGGATVIDYRISYDQSIGDFIILETGVTDNFYQTTVALTPGAHYLLSVEARNSVGYSLGSDNLSVHAAQIPDKPANPITSISEPNVIVTWVAPYDGDTPITSYVIVFEASDGSYIEDVLICDGSLAETIASR